MLPHPCLETTGDSLIAVQISDKIDEPDPSEKWSANDVVADADPKKKGKDEPEEEPPKEEVKLTDFQALMNNPPPIPVEPEPEPEGEGEGEEAKEPVEEGQEEGEVAEEDKEEEPVEENPQDSLQFEEKRNPLSIP